MYVNGINLEGIKDHDLSPTRTSETTKNIGHGKMNATLDQSFPSSDNFVPGKLNGTSTMTTNTTEATNTTIEKMIVKRQCCTTKPAAVCCPTTVSSYSTITQQFRQYIISPYSGWFQIHHTCTFINTDFINIDSCIVLFD